MITRQDIQRLKESKLTGLLSEGYTQVEKPQWLSKHDRYKALQLADDMPHIIYDLDTSSIVAFYVKDQDNFEPAIDYQI